MIYLDYVATTPVHDEIIEGYHKLASQYFYNSESLYGQGIKVNSLQEKSRSNIAAMLKVKSEEIIFTSCGSEANNTAIKGIALKYASRGRHIISTNIEHSSVESTLDFLERVHGFEVTRLECDSTGHVPIDTLEKSIREDTILVSIMHVNNEVGSINPIEQIKEIVVKYPKCFFHVDMVQSLGKLPVELDGIDLATFSAHKIHGLKGSGILYRRQGITLEPVIHGGTQEFNVRGGTHNAPANIIFAKTLKLALQNQERHLSHTKALHDHFIENIRTIEDLVINSGGDCLPSIISLSLVGYKPEVILHQLESKGILISTKSACSSKLAGVSRVLANLDIDENVAKSAIRISFDLATSFEDVDYLIASLKDTLKDIRKSR